MFRQEDSRNVLQNARKYFGGPNKKLDLEKIYIWEKWCDGWLEMVKKGFNKVLWD